jgi:hypothetical protein
MAISYDLLLPLFVCVITTIMAYQKKRHGMANDEKPAKLWLVVMTWTFATLLAVLAFV